MCGASVPSVRAPSVSITKLRRTIFEERSALSTLRELIQAADSGEIRKGSEVISGSFPVISEREVYLEPATPPDQPFMYATFASTRTEELAVTGWSDEQKEQFLRLQFEAQRISYLREIPDAEYSVVRCGTAAVGRLIVERTPTEVHIVDITLLAEFRRQGIGSILMGRLFDEAAKADKSVRLFVEKFNPALRWYERMRFEVIRTGPIYLEMIWRPASAVKGLTRRLHK
jgi:ribosomal protein S18 acetylase RimI-like enzyme